MEFEDIRNYIPQREPILMVDRLHDIDEAKVVTRFVISEDNFFVDKNGMMTEAGILENIAQSASAYAGYFAKEKSAENPPVGYIGEIKKFHCYRCPYVGEELQTTIVKGTELGGVTIVTGETYVGDEKIADTQMKIFIN